MKGNSIDQFARYDTKTFSDDIKSHSTEAIQKRLWIEYGLIVTTTPCNYGGVRYWFQCPICGNRYRILYGSVLGPVCRNCLGLTYYSQRRTKTALNYSRDRLQSVINQVDDSYLLYGKVPTLHTFPGKPPRMHWSTYQRLYDRYTDELDRFSIVFLTGYDMSTKRASQALNSGVINIENETQQMIDEIMNK